MVTKPTAAIHVPEDLHRRLRRHCVATGQTMGAFVDGLVVQEVERCRAQAKSGHGTQEKYDDGCRCARCCSGNRARTLDCYWKQRATGRQLKRSIYGF